LENAQLAAISTSSGCISGKRVRPLGPLIADDLQLSNAQVGLLPSFLFLGQMFVSIPSGLLVDRIGTRKLLLWVCLLLGSSYFIGSLVSNFITLLIFIMIGGMAYGSMHPVTNRGILFWFPKKRGTAMGIKQMGITFGSALAAIAILPLAVATSWRLAMGVSCLLLIVSGIISYRFYQERKLEVKMGNGQNKSLMTDLLEVVKHRPLLLISIVAFILNGSQMSVNMYLLFFIKNELLFSLAIAGTMFVFSEVGGSVGRIVWGVISDTFFRGSRFAVMLLITFIACAGSAMMAFLSESTPVWLLLILVFTMGLAVSGFNGLWMNIATELTPKEQAGVASGVSLTIGSMGVILVPPLFGLTVDMSGSFELAWQFMAGLMVIASIVLLGLRKMRSF
jgi:MFS family permease